MRRIAVFLQKPILRVSQQKNLPASIPIADHQSAEFVSYMYTCRLNMCSSHRARSFCIGPIASDILIAFYYQLIVLLSLFYHLETIITEVSESRTKARWTKAPRTKAPPQKGRT